MKGRWFQLGPGRAVLPLSLVWLAACGGAKTGTKSSSDSAPWFENVVDGSGIDFEHVSGPQRFWFPEIMGGGVALLDYDADGWLDIYLVQSGDLEPGSARPGNALYRNLGGWRFEDVTAAAGVGDRGYGMGCTVGDYDGDGDLDLYVTNLGPNVLYRNEGDGTFTDVARASGVADAGWGDQLRLPRS